MVFLRSKHKGLIWALPFFVILLLFGLGVAQTSQSSSGSSSQKHTPSLTVEDIAAKNYGPREGAVTEVQVLVHARSSNVKSKEFRCKGNDCFFSLPWRNREALDKNNDGIVDHLAVWVKTVDGHANFEFSTDRIGVNLGGNFDGTDASLDYDLKLPGFRVESTAGGCFSTGRGSFQVLDSQFEFNKDNWRMISFAASFTQSCPTAEVTGHIYYNYVP